MIFLVNLYYHPELIIKKMKLLSHCVYTAKEFNSESIQFDTCCRRKHGLSLIFSRMFLLCSIPSSVYLRYLRMQCCLASFSSMLWLSFSTKFGQALFFLPFFIIFAQVVAWRCSIKKVFLVILPNSHATTCARASFLIKLQDKACNFIKKEILAQVFSCEFGKNF